MIHTPIDIDFQGLTNVPSDYACQDGELATCLNLIPEDGELHPIGGKKIVESFGLPAGAKIAFVHKVTHNGNLHTHYIIQNGNNIYWQEKGAPTYNPTLLYSGVPNSVTAIGSILCFVEDSSTKYAYWKEDRYTVFNLSDLNYTVTISNTTTTYFAFGTSLSEEDWNASFQKDEKTPSPLLKGASIIFNTLDALINKKMEELGDEYFKYLQFGVVALRLYDGTYINISNPFVLAPNAISNKFEYLKDEKYISSAGYLHKHTINVEMDIKEGLEDIVQGATVFLTQPESFINTNIAPIRIYSKYNPQYDDNLVFCSGAFYFKEAKESMEQIDTLSYYRCTDIDIDEFGKNVKLRTIKQVEESLSLADMGRLSYGGTCAIAYNNRLHIANVRKSFFNAFDSTSHDVILLPSHSPVDITFQGCYLNTLTAVNGMTTSCLCDAIFEVTLGDTMKNKTLRYKGKMQYPLQPIISFPDASASKLVVYLNVSPLSTYYKLEFNLHKSNTCGMSYYILFGDRQVMKDVETYTNYGYDNLGLPQFMQYEKFKLTDNNGTLSWVQDGTNEIFTKITADEYNAALAKVQNSTQSAESSPSLIKVSEAENPLVFPAKNSVQVGSSQVQALAANTRPITEGQFGEAPLYVFTDEGVWMLMLGGDMEGTYQARQPVNRYICTNPSGILQIDEAIVYPTEQGIMLQEGSKVTCITDILDDRGTPYDFLSLPHAAEILDTSYISHSYFGYVPFRTFLANVRMVYDYCDKRIIIFNPNYNYAYVYSLKSQKWGMMDSDLSDRVDIYPEAYAIDRNNAIVNLYNPSPSATYVLCTRPINFGTHSFKTLFDIMARGYFPPRQKGKCGMALFGSNNLNKWLFIGSGIYPDLQLQGSPYKYFRIALIGTLSAGETLSGFSADIQERWQNSLR